jgi:bifunctional lysine-specific demethylase and histidyl-hydroxylase NO66
MSEVSVLARYVGDPSTFLTEYWGKKVLHRPSADRVTFDDLITIDEVDRLISSTLPHYPDVNLVKDGMQIDPAQFSHPPDPRRGGARVVDAARVYEYFHAGATIQMQGIHFRHPPLADLCRQLEIELSVPVQANMYITPPRSRGLGLHADTHDVLVLQVSGTKHWQVFEPVPPETDLDDPATEPPLRLDTELARGDGLYLPRGVPHRVASTTAASIHLTIGFVAPSWGDVLKDVVGNVVAELGQEAAFRAPLPAGFATDNAALSEAMAERLRHLADRIGSVDPRQAADWVTRRFWADRAPIMTGQLAQLIDLPELNRDSVLARRPASIAQVSQSGDTLTLILGDRSLQLPAKLRSVVDFIVAKTTFTLRELDPYLDEPSQLVLARRLVREGLLVRR